MNIFDQLSQGAQINWAHKVRGKFKIETGEKVSACRYKKGKFYNPNEGDVMFDSSWEEIRFRLLTDKGYTWFRNHGIRIPYVSPEDGRTHHYIPDILIITKTGKVMEEIKPASQVNDPVVQAKATAAIEFLGKQGITYRFVTEHNLTTV